MGVLESAPGGALEARGALLEKGSGTRAGVAWGFDSDKATEEFSPAARDLNAPGSRWDSHGDAKAEIGKAATLIEATYTNDYAYHAQMEPLNAVASVSPARDSAEIWCGTQSQTMAQEAVAKVL